MGVRVHQSDLHFIKYAKDPTTPGSKETSEVVNMLRRPKRFNHDGWLIIWQSQFFLITCKTIEWIKIIITSGKTVSSNIWYLLHTFPKTRLIPSSWILMARVCSEFVFRSLDRIGSGLRQIRSLEKRFYWQLNMLQLRPVLFCARIKLRW